MQVDLIQKTGKEEEEEEDYEEEEEEYEEEDEEDEEEDEEEEEKEEEEEEEKETVRNYSYHSSFVSGTDDHPNLLISCPFIYSSLQQKP